MMPGHQSRGGFQSFTNIYKYEWALSLLYLMECRNLSVFLIEVYLIYNVMLISAIQQSDQVTHIYTFFFFLIFFPIMEYSSLFYTTRPCCLSILHTKLTSGNANLPIHLFPHSLSLGNRQSVLCVHDSVFVSEIHSFGFCFRFCM